MGLNVQSGHRKVVAGVCALPSPLLQASGFVFCISASATLRSDRAMLVGRSHQDVSARLVLSFFFCLSVSCLFPPVFLLFHGVRTGGVSGVMDTSDGSLPFATHLSLPEIVGEGVVGSGLDCAHTLSLLHVEIGAGVGAGREGGLPAG